MTEMVEHDCCQEQDSQEATKDMCCAQGGCECAMGCSAVVDTGGVVVCGSVSLGYQVSGYQLLTSYPSGPFRPPKS